MQQSVCKQTHTIETSVEEKNGWLPVATRRCKTRRFGRFSHAESSQASTPAWHTADCSAKERTPGLKLHAGDL
jgi:hypothetical protein